MRMDELERILSLIPRQSIVLFSVKSSDYFNFNIELMKRLIMKEKRNGIYVSMNKPHANVLKTFEEHKIPSNDVYFIDCVTQMIGGDTSHGDGKCTFLDSISNLTDLSIAIDSAALKHVKNNCFLFLDSISTLLVYNSKEHVTQFAHFVSNKLRMYGLAGAFISLERESDSDVITSIVPFCDSYIEVSD